MSNIFSDDVSFGWNEPDCELRSSIKITATCYYVSVEILTVTKWTRSNSNCKSYEGSPASTVTGFGFVQDRLDYSSIK